MHDVFAGIRETRGRSTAPARLVSRKYQLPSPAVVGEDLERFAYLSSSNFETLRF